MTDLYRADALTAFADALLQKAGLAAPMAASVARTLVDGDLLGHDTHGLALLAGYLKELESGGMTRDGANDLPMMGEAGLSVAYHAKPKVREQAMVAINEGGLDRLLEVLR